MSHPAFRDPPHGRVGRPSWSGGERFGAVLLVWMWVVPVAAGPVLAADADAGGSADAAADVRTGDDLAAWLDERFAQAWEREGVRPTQCDDAAFIRRVYLDLLGRVPSVAETREFLGITHPDRYERLVDRLLFGPNQPKWGEELYAENMARLWRRMMVPPGTNGSAMAVGFEPWLVEQFRANVGYDELARRLIAPLEPPPPTNPEPAKPGDPIPPAGGDPRVAAFYQAVGNSPETSAGAVTRVFLGSRIACAQCHDHPFAEWKQKDFWGMAAFFSAVPNGSGIAAAAGPGKISYEGVTYAARFLGEDEDAAVSPSDDPRDLLAGWLTAPENLDFAATAVNRVWQQLLGRSLVPGVDDLDLVSDEERAVLLDPLARRFVEAKFDVRWLVAGICKSRAYRCASTADPDEAAFRLGTARPLKTLSPEQLFDSLEQALMLPTSSVAEDAARHNGLRAQLLARFDESAGRSPEDYAAGVPQVLMLMNGRLTAEATDLETSRTLRAVVDAPFLSAGQKLDALFLATLTRFPSEHERELVLGHVQSAAERKVEKQAYAEVFWALLNSPEFVLCR